jgi:hypothetical protein
MGTLKSSTVQPSIVENEFARLEMRKERNRNERVLDDLAGRLAYWKKLRGTAVGQTLMEVADPEIKHYQELLDKPVSQLLHLGSIEVINETRAEWRGCLAVWKSIKYNLVEYERLLQEIKKMIETEGKATEEARKKKIDKYS